jgi:tellurite resistance protein TerC
MNVPTWLWLATIGGLTAVILADLLLANRTPRTVTIGHATGWVMCYVALAGLFALGLWVFAGATPAGGFAAGYLTEYSLSTDNLFVFVIILARFRVPAAEAHRVLLAGIVVALTLRGVFIGIGAAAVARFAWVFYLFAAMLIYTAIGVARQGVHHQEEFTENRLLRRLRGWRVSPMLVVMVAIGTTDVLFALDSIPAIFGLTQDAYLIFTANAFALMGLRQLYFLIGGLLKKLVHLSVGLSVILGFIGVKLALHALHTNTLPFINSGRPVPVPEVGTGLSIGVIAGILMLTTVTSLVATRRKLGVAGDPVPERTRG